MTTIHSNSSYSGADRQAMLRVAAMSAFHAAEHNGPLTVDPAQFSERLRERRAVFVTFNRQGQLRGCVGTLQANKALITEIAQFSFAAVARDPRFPRVTPQELPMLDIHISVLSEPSQMSFSSQADLLDQVRVDVDGLILGEGSLRGTFLPSVWKQLPEKAKFLEGLKAKAGLPQGYWSPTLKVWRYTTETVE